MKQGREPRNKPKYIQSIDLTFGKCAMCKHPCVEECNWTFISPHIQKQRQNG
jgi:hypothetical protein